MAAQTTKHESYALIDEDGVLSWDDMTTDDEEINVDTVADNDKETITEDYYDGLCDNYLNFTDSNPTTFHVVKYFSDLLESNGFEYIDEQAPVTEQLAAKLNSGGLFYTTRGGLTILPFAIGGGWSPEKGAGVVGSHIDAITTKLKPSSLKKNIDGYNMLGVAGYSGALKPLWLDRDLGIGGNIIVKDHETHGFKRVLIKSPIPIAKIPSLAPHFHHSTSYNPETELVPITGYTETDGAAEETKLQQEFEKSHPLGTRHSAKLMYYLSKISDIPIEDIVELELELFDVEPATRGGINGEFMFAPRLDDRLCSFAAIYGLIEYSKQFVAHKDISEYTGLNMVLLVDNEEIGSGTRTGVKGKFLNSTIQKILSVKKGSNLDSLVFSNSVILSADVTHLMNPNFKNVYLEKHYPLPNTGVTIKLDPNGHVVSDYVGYNLLSNITARNHLKLQQFHIRNDSRSGGTIGPQLAVDTGARVIDVGIPILSMHSIRAACGYKDVGLGANFFKAFFSEWRSEYNNYRGM